MPSRAWAALFVADLRGSYSGVMGLPLFETARLLAAASIDCLASPRQATKFEVTGA